LDEQQNDLGTKVDLRASFVYVTIFSNMLLHSIKLKLGTRRKQMCVCGAATEKLSSNGTLFDLDKINTCTTD